MKTTTRITFQARNGKFQVILDPDKHEIYCGLLQRKEDGRVMGEILKVESVPNLQPATCNPQPTP